MWHDPMDELIVDLDGVIEAHRRKYTDQPAPFMDMQHWNTRILRRADAELDGVHPDDEVDPSSRPSSPRAGCAGSGSTGRAHLSEGARDQELPWIPVPGR